jgi:hypothetical protein
MAKQKRKKTTGTRQQPAKFTISTLQQNIIFIVIIIIYLMIMMKPLVIDGLSPKGVDVVASRGQTNLIIEFNKENDEQALWNPAIFCGMPIYHRLSAKAFSLDQIINWFGGIFSAPFAYYVLGALGLFTLLRYLKMIPFLSFMGTMFFILMPHYSSLYLEGHFAKLRAVMFIPWIILCFLYYLDRRTILSAALFALAFGLQIRTQHYQIVFYTALLIFSIGVYPMIKDLVNKEYLKFSKSTLLLVAAIVLGITMSAQPLFLAKEYLPYSKRGKTTISLDKPLPQSVESQSAGVTIDYATQWSTHPYELLTWAVPRFFGGMSGEKYTGSSVPALKNRTIPGYWGYMPFTQSYEYMGVITLLLAFIGIYAFRRDKLVLSLIIIGAFFILLSFGRHFLIFYEIFFNYFPYFNKFRAPMMSVTITGIILAILATYGMNYLYTIHNDQKYEELKKILWIPGIFIALGVLILIFSQGFSFSKPGETYEPRVMQLLQQVRSEFFNQDLIRYFLISIISGGILFVFFKRKLSFIVSASLLTIIGILDLTNIQSRYSHEFVNTERLEKQFFKKNATNNFILSDTETFRIMPPPAEMSSNRWAYYHQIIGGYSPIKMYTVEELLQNCLNKSTDGKFPLNLNVIRMFNVKYIVLNQKIAHPDMILVHSDDRNKLYTYQLQTQLSRGFFVNKQKVIQDQYERLNYINQAQFNPADEAIIETELHQPIGTPDSTTSVLTNFTPNLLEFDVYTDKQALFVISESHYPPGWKAFIDEKEVTEIYKTNHSMQSIIVPAGKHKVELKFEPSSYYSNLTVASISVSVIYLVILLSLGIGLKKHGMPFFRSGKTSD